MVKIIIQNCPACGSSKYEKVLTASDYLVSGESFEIMECNDCSLRFTSPIPDSNEVVNYYESDKYISHVKRVTSIFETVYKIVRKFTLCSKRKIVKRISQKKSGSVLDIGCGTGEFLKTMKQSGWEITGVEVNEEARKLADVNTNSVILTQTEFIESTQKYDLITLWHSFEHLHELDKYLNKIFTSLNANGVVIIAVPNYKSFDAEYYQHNWAAYDVPRHLYHFSPEAMVKLMEKFNFKLMQSKQLPFDPFYVSLLSETSVRLRRNVVKAMLVGWKSYWQGRRDSKKGSSILYILKANEDTELN